MPTPSKFTDATRRAILDALSEGDSRETAAAMVGVNPAQISRWIKRGSEAERGSEYREFAENVAMAEAAARGRALRILNKKMVDEPKWAAWFLERRDPAFSPPMTRQPAAQQGVVVIQLALPDGRPVPSSTVMQLPSAAEPA